MASLKLSSLYPPRDGDFVAILSIYPDHPGEATVSVRLTKDQLAQLSDDASDIWAELPKVEPEKAAWPAPSEHEIVDNRERAEAINKERRQPL